MFCQQCGTQIEDGMAFCTACGAKQATANAATTNSNAVNNNQTRPVMNGQMLNKTTSFISLQISKNLYRKAMCSQIHMHIQT